MTYIATFFNHFGAIRFNKMCQGAGYTCKMQPVPRSLSSSCGTCVRYEGDKMMPSDEIPEEIEQIVSVTADGYVCLYKAEDS